MTGIVLHQAAEPHLYDAANLYNDRIDAGWRPAIPTAAKSAAPALAPAQR